MALLQTPAQVKNNKLLKLPGQKTLAEAEDQTKQVATTTSPLLAQAAGASPMAAAMAASPAHKEKVAEGTTPQRTQTQTADSISAKRTGLLERGGGSIDDVTSKLVQDIDTLGSIERQVPAKALEKINNSLLPAAPVVQKLTIKKGHPLEKADLAVQEALAKGQAVFMDPATGAVSFGGTAIQPATFGSSPVASTVAGAEIANIENPEDSLLKAYDRDAGIVENVKQSLPAEIPMDWLSGEERGAMERAGLDSEATHAELQNAARRVETKLADVDRARATVLNAMASMEEKAAAQRYLREQGFSGRLTAAEKANDLVAQITDNDEVKIGTDSMRIEEILSDEFLQGRISDMLADPALLASAKKDPALKGLAEYVERNAEAWDKLLTPVKGALEQVRGIRTANTKQASFGTGAMIPPELMDELLPGWKDLNKTGQLQVPPILKTMQMSKNPVHIKSMQDLLTGALADKSIAPKRWEQLVGMSPQELEKAGLLSGETTWEELEVAELEKASLKDKVGANLAETTANFLGASAPTVTSSVKSTFENLSKAGVDINRLKDPAYTAGLPDSIKAQIPKFVKLMEKFNPDGTMKHEYIGTLTGSQDFFGGGDAAATLDVEDLIQKSAEAAEAASAYEGITAGNQAITTQQGAIDQKKQEVEFAGRTANWDRSAELISKNLGFPAPLSYTQIQAWANRLPPAEIQSMLSTARIDPRNPQPIRALLETANGQYALEQKLKTSGFGVDAQKLHALMKADTRIGEELRTYYIERNRLRDARALTPEGKAVRDNKLKALEAKYAGMLSTVYAQAGTIGSKTDVMAATNVALTNASNPTYKGQQPPDAPTFN